MKPLFLLFLAGGFCHAAIETLFVIGGDDGTHEPFGAETGSTDVNDSESPTTLDDHFYVSSNEAVANFERAFTSWDPSIVIHFDLTAGQTNLDGIFEFAIDLLWSGRVEEDPPATNEPVNHVLTCRLNGTDFLTTPLFDGDREFRVEIATVPGLVQTGANTLEIVRTDGTEQSWLGIDYVELSVDPTARQDTDGDGLPQRWETLYQLSDNNPLDANESADDDLLTNLQEFLAGTSPRDSDTDDDGLADHLETTTSALNPDSDDDGLLDGAETSSNPALADSDGDGAFDAWEIRTGFDPASNTSTPPSFSGAIGINFRSEIDAERGAWTSRAPNGRVPRATGTRPTCSGIGV